MANGYAALSEQLKLLAKEWRQSGMTANRAVLDVVD